ncbi:hypothetical protein Lal_00024169 [Lupinus albus]|uniref:Putative GTD-binding domain-containing protein n=1 Tax=Lupinus albus TaxID=3870 RepID=A0A6A5P6V8_LUPAL|nr:putative GTD-binding domain-containing protein [Lupinus albus]KAF1893046.1 hypothetical protein Lal_00024169 [Lupinus albus]
MATRSFTRYVEEELGKFPYFVLYVFLEWVLIIVLFLDGFLAFLANEFARFFELKIPCWLCTRFDHILVHRNPSFYYNESICESHKKDISSLAFCHNHKKLSDIRKMCEGCLLSFATERESDIDTYKSLVGILHKDLECFVEDGQPIQLSLKDEEMTQVETSRTQKCSCCGKPLRVKSSHGKPRRLESFARAPTPSPRAYPFSAFKNEENNALDSPRIPYSELKFMENDLELPEYDDGSNANNQNIKLKEDPKVLSMPLMADGSNLNEESHKLTPTFSRSNKFFGIPLTDSANNSPRWSYRINRKSPLEKTELAYESNEVNIQNDFDDAILNNLKRQVRLDRKSLMALYMELDEERSASAVAANNAMAMITRLQAEKAAVQMEALQYQRMMEEQAEYDEEALQASNDMILKREEEIKVLETELEIYRNKHGILAEEDVLKVANISHESLNGGEDSGDKGLISDQLDGGIRPIELIKDFKAEKTYLLGRMKKTENSTSITESGTYSLNSSSDSINTLGIETGIESEASLPKELSSLTERVKALEENSGFLEIVSKKPEKNCEGTKILTEISMNLEQLSHLVMTSIEVDNDFTQKDD